MTTQTTSPTTETPKPPRGFPAGLSYPLDGRRHHKLMDAASVRSLPPIYSQQHAGDNATAYVKLFCPYSGQRWYLLEMNPPDTQVFAFTTTKNNEPEYCYVDLDELGNAAGMRGALPLVERDLHYTPLIIAQIRAGAY